MLKAISPRRSVWVSSVLLLALISLPAFAQHYTRTDLTANSAATSSTAANIDANLVNAWGLSRSSGSPWWISDNGTALATLYTGVGSPVALVVNIDGPKGTPGNPTGTVFNYTTAGFPAAPGVKSLFMFVTIQGTIDGWNPAVKGAEAVVLHDSKGKAVYTGCTLATNRFGTFLYAANFKTGDVEVYDSNFNHIFNFDTHSHDIPRDFHAFNVQNVGGNLVVTFAKPGPDGRDEHAPGLGFVAIYNQFGRMIQRLDHGKFLNAPWGVTESPSDFGAFSHRLLVGNFGDGTINVFNTVTGEFEGKLEDSTGAPLWIDGVWSLSFASNTAGVSGSAIELYFTAGPGNGTNGLFGKVVPVAAEQRGNNE